MTQLCISTPHLSKFRTFMMKHHLTQPAFGSFSGKVFDLLKKALHVGAARNKWLK